MAGNLDANSIYHFLDTLQQVVSLPPGARNDVTFQRRSFRYASSLQLSDAERSRPRNSVAYPPSLGSDEAPSTPTDIERFEESSQYSMSSAPSLLGPEPLAMQRPALPPFETALLEQTTSELQGSPLPCEFFWFTGCNETFELDQDVAWVEHVVSQHLRGDLPKHCICWFCDHMHFEARSVGYEDNKANLGVRIRHIADHFRQGQTMREIRPDHFFLDHIYEKGLISQSVFRNAREYHEAPQPRDGINSVPPRNRNRAQYIAMEERSRPRGHRESQRSYRY